MRNNPRDAKKEKDHPPVNDHSEATAESKDKNKKKLKMIQPNKNSMTKKKPLKRKITVIEVLSILQKRNSRKMNHTIRLSYAH